VSLLVAFAGGLPAQNGQSQRQTFTVQGKVARQRDNAAIPGATVALPAYGLTGVADVKGVFSIERVPSGRTRVVISYQGYVRVELDLDISRNLEGLNFRMREDNLTLETVVVTAKENRNSLNTSHIIERQALEHMQVLSATDVMSLLPGGQTRKADLLSDSGSEAFRFKLRGGDGNGTFGTAVEVDGVRLSSNGNMTTGLEGPMTRNIGVTDIESVEIMTGVPSAEYGDMTSGMVMIKTRKGRTPYQASISVNPTAKTYALSKGFSLGKKNGTLNASVEYTHAFQQPYSRYTTYSRNAYSVAYSNNFRLAGRVLDLSVNAGGNYGQKNIDHDPDLPSVDWTKNHDNGARAGFNATWQINSRWITALAAEANANYFDQFAESYTYVAGSTSKPTINSTESGYFETARQPTMYYRDRVVDSKGLNMGAKLRYRLNRRFGRANNNIKAGLGWSSSGNVGRGEWYRNGIEEDGYRPYPYTGVPFVNNWSAYVEDNLHVPTPGRTAVDLMAGVRYERVDIRDMVYKNANSLSPRFNVRYTIVDGNRSKKGFLRELSVRGGWGMMEKLPSLGLLYQRPRYHDMVVFDKNYGTNNSYYTVGLTNVYNELLNPQLEWSRSRNAELGLSANLGGVSVSVAYFNNRAKNPYISETVWEAFAYRRSDGQFAVPNNPGFRVDRNSGEVWVRDLDNPSSGETLIPALVNDTLFLSNSRPNNGAPYTTQGVELTLDFGRIKAIRTSFRLDAAYFSSKRIDERLAASYTANTSYAGLPVGRSYNYVLFYPGSVTTENGSRTSSVNANLTATTHIPEVRMTVSLRLESNVISRSQALTQYNGAEWAFMVDEHGNRLPSVYGQRYTAHQYPVAYMGFDGVMHPFTEVNVSDPRFWNADRTSNTDAHFLEDGNNLYVSTVNLSITKEIGDMFSLSFYANNFINSDPPVRSIASGLRSPRGGALSYGATLRIRIK
jgi:hypothetical protein